MDDRATMVAGTIARRSRLFASCRGDVLLEVLIAVAVFAAGAALLLTTARESLSALDRADQRERAVDLARSIFARLEAGELNVQDLRADRAAGDEDEGAWRDERFALETSTERTSWSGLTLVELRVRDADAASDAPPLCTLRQLVRLGGSDEDPTATPNAGSSASPAAEGE